MLKHIVVRIEFNLFNQSVGILLRVEYQSEQNVTITALTKIQHVRIRKRELRSFR
jgi:hypothetical protein